MEEWYYTRNGEQQGPVNLETLRQMAENGSLKPEDMVWNSSMADWVPSSEVQGIHVGTVTPSLAPGAPPIPQSAGSWASDPNLQEIEPGSDPLDVGTVISSTFALTKKNFAPLLLMGVIVFGVSAAFSIVQRVVMMLSGIASEPSQTPIQTIQGPDSFQIQEYAFQSSQASDISLGLLLIFFVFQIVGSVVNLWLSLGLTRACLKIVDGQEAQVPMLFGEAGKLLRALGASILCCLMVVVGFLLLIIPGIYLCIKLSVVIPAIVDRNMGVMDAINYSFRITKGNAWMLLLLWFIGVILMIVAIVFTCGLGAIIAGPIFTLGWILCYRWMQYGRRVAG